MAFTNADLLTSNPTARWLIENSPLKLQIARVWPFLGVDGGTITYGRRTGVLSPAGIITGGSPAPDNSDTVESVEFTFAEFVTSYQINAGDLDVFQQPNDPDAVEYALALRRLLYAYFAQLDAAPGTGGLQDSIVSGNIVNVGGGALTLDLLDQAYHFVTANDGRPTVIMASSRGLLTYQKLCRDKGYDTPTMPYQWYDPALGQMVPGVAPAFNGTPILINDLLAGAASGAGASAQRIYFLVLGDDGKAGPTRGVTGIVPENLKRSMFVKRSTMGLLTEFSQPADTIVTTWVSWPAGFAVPSQGSISMMYNFTPAA